MFPVAQLNLPLVSVNEPSWIFSLTMLIRREWRKGSGARKNSSFTLLSAATTCINTLTTSVHSSNCKLSQQNSQWYDRWYSQQNSQWYDRWYSQQNSQWYDRWYSQCYKHHDNF
ncbi:hypothetical protein Hamer_G004437 [Homarus americanus]|uniref:Uncharacterized protein n=1 Tax=Homarus americanus TaxID=6706 RepID=A0A8J5K1G8_HOMAM|nr:hypothetical protein Hamer_G004437 [Homarus americanus]